MRLVADVESNKNRFTDWPPEIKKPIMEWLEANGVDVDAAVRVEYITGAELIIVDEAQSVIDDDGKRHFLVNMEKNGFLLERYMWEVSKPAGAKIELGWWSQMRQ